MVVDLAEKKHILRTNTTHQNMTSQNNKVILRVKRDHINKWFYF